MTIYKYLPKENYTKFDNRVLVINRNILADGAKILYVYLASHMVGKRITYEYIKKSMGFSQSSLEKYVRQLKALDLMLMHRVKPKQYDCYIGSTEVPASVVKIIWKELSEEDADNPYTHSDIMRMQAKYIKEK